MFPFHYGIDTLLNVQCVQCIRLLTIQTSMPCQTDCKTGWLTALPSSESFISGMHTTSASRSDFGMGLPIVHRGRNQSTQEKTTSGMDALAEEKFCLHSVWVKFLSGRPMRLCYFCLFLFLLCLSDCSMAFIALSGRATMGNSFACFPPRKELLLWLL